MTALEEAIIRHLVTFLIAFPGYESDGRLSRRRHRHRHGILAALVSRLAVPAFAASADRRLNAQPCLTRTKQIRGKRMRLTRVES